MPSSRLSHRTIRPARFQEGASQSELATHIGNSEQEEQQPSDAATLPPPIPLPTFQKPTRKRRKLNQTIKTESQVTAIVPGAKVAAVVTGKTFGDVINTAVNTIDSTQIIDYKAINYDGKP